MSRKSKSQRRKRKSRVQNVSTPTPQAETTSKIGLNPANSFNPDYTYIIGDLKRIGSLAGFFLAALVVLSFFLK